MANATSRTATSESQQPAATVIWPTFTLDLFMKAQQAQWDAWSTSQRSLLTWNKALWEQWACRFASGVPIDG